MFKKVGNCIICGGETQKFCDSCEAFICEMHSRKPFANKEIVLCNNCWKNRNNILNKIKKRDLSSIETSPFDISPEHP